MVILRARQALPGQSDADQRAHIPAVGELALYVDPGGVRHLVVGDGTRTIGQMVDADDYFALLKDLP